MKNLHLKFVAFVLIIISLPIFFIVAVLIFFQDGFPIIFKQERIGLNNKNFYIYKFRTMKNNMKDVPTHLLKNRENTYTQTGPFLRKYSLDELPQLFNVLKSELTFIGPRPALHNQNDLKSLRIEKGVDSLIPGITGWAQVNGRDKLSINEKVELDYYYLKNKSFWFDLKILWLTFLKVFKAEDIL